MGAALDRGVTLFDTAPSYGTSEERLGRALGARRYDVVLATKGGYGIDGVADWTPDVIRLGVERALGRLCTDVIDVFFVHSCDLTTLERGGVIDALDRAKEAGKVRLAGYSSDEEPLRWAVRSGRFDVVKCSVSLLDRVALDESTVEVERRGIGVFAKRPLANGAMGSSGSVDETRADLREYRERARVLAIDTSPIVWPEAAVRLLRARRHVGARRSGSPSPRRSHVSRAPRFFAVRFGRAAAVLVRVVSSVHLVTSSLWLPSSVLMWNICLRCGGAPASCRIIIVRR